MLAERVEQWAHEYEARGEARGEAKGEAKGVQKGMQQGESLALQKLLTKRFGTIPSYITARIATASLEDIEHWFDRAIEASGYDDVFGLTGH